MHLKFISSSSFTVIFVVIGMLVVHSVIILLLPSSFTTHTSPERYQSVCRARALVSFFPTFMRSFFPLYFFFVVLCSYRCILAFISYLHRKDFQLLFVFFVCLCYLLLFFNLLQYEDSILYILYLLSLLCTSLAISLPMVWY